MRQLTVHLGPRSYPILIGRGLLPKVGAELARLGLGERVAIVAQPPVATRYGAVVRERLAAAGFRPLLIEVPDGEAAKTLAQAQALWDAFLDAGLDRTSAAVAVGGGAVGDLAGFAAAAFMRGLPWVQVPTTLLAQVDASVGGKVAINHPRAKNLVGAFHQPRLVLIDPETLATLPDREFRAGLAEVIKCGAALSAELFAVLETRLEAILARDPEALETVIAACCELKATIVEQDEREESGLRMLLNYGHTVGHALESLGGYTDLLHGEAVAVGMVLAARLAGRLGLTERETVERQVALIRAAGLPVAFSTSSPGEVVEALRHDKKARGGRVPFVLLKALGHAEVCFDVPVEVVREVLDEIHEAPTPARGA